MQLDLLVLIIMVGIVWGILPHINKEGMRIEGLANYTAKRYVTAATILAVFALLFDKFTDKTHTKFDASLDRSVHSVLSGCLSAVSFLVYMYCLYKSESPTLVTSSVYVLGLLSALIVGLYLRDEHMSTRHKVGVMVSMIACGLLAS